MATQANARASGGRAGGIDLLLFLAVAGVTLAVELWLVQRRFDFLGPRVMRERTIDTASEYLAFGSTLLACQLCLLFALWALVGRLGAKRGRRLVRIDFVFLALFLFVGAAAAKYRTLSLLGDSTGLEMIRNLAGGSLFAALVYVRDEGAPFVWAGAGMLAAWLVVRRLLARAPLPSVRDTVRARHRAVRPAAIAGTLSIPLLLLFAGRAGDARPALERFTAPWLALALLNRASDFDWDGYSWISAQPDSHPFDSARHPYALDVPGNGVDEDGFGGDFRYAGDSSATPTPPLGPDPKHVVLIVLESVRADALTKSWNGRIVAPNLRALAARGSHSADAWSHVGFTAQSLMTLFTGRIEPAPGDPSLFSDFRSNGYRVATFSAQSADFGGVAEAVGMRANSHVMVDARALAKERLFDSLSDIRLVVDDKSLLREMDRHFGRPGSWSRPNFLYFNFQAAHYPYHTRTTPLFLPGPPIPSDRIGRDNRAWVERSYWNSVAYADWLVGQVAARLERLGVLDRTVILAVGDHGEELFEEGYIGHGAAVSAAALQVPLVSNVPGLALPPAVGLTDVRRVLLAAAGAKLAPRPPRPIFHLIGRLDRPSAIALNDGGGRLTILDLTTGDVTYTDLGVTLSYRQLPADGAQRIRADAVANRWAEERWTKHVRLAGGRRR